MIQAVQYLNTLSPRVRQVIYLAYLLAGLVAFVSAAAFSDPDPAWVGTLERVLAALSVPMAALAVTHVNTGNAETKVEVPQQDAKSALADAEPTEDDSVEVEAPQPDEVD